MSQQFANQVLSEMLLSSLTSLCFTGIPYLFLLPQAGENETFQAGVFKNAFKHCAYQLISRLIGRARDTEAVSNKPDNAEQWICNNTGEIFWDNIMGNVPFALLDFAFAEVPEAQAQNQRHPWLRAGSEEVLGLSLGGVILAGCDSYYQTKAKTTMGLRCPDD